MLRLAQKVGSRGRARCLAAGARAHGAVRLRHRRGRACAPRGTARVQRGGAAGVSRRSPARRQHAEEAQAYRRRLLRGARTGWTRRSRGACSGGLLLDETRRALQATDRSGCTRGRCRRPSPAAMPTCGRTLRPRTNPPPRATRHPHRTPHTSHHRAREVDASRETGVAADARVPDANRAAVGATTGVAAGVEGPGGTAGPAGLCAVKAGPSRCRRTPALSPFGEA